jgi:ankyrin repeat protein
MPEELQSVYQLLLDNLRRDNYRLRALEWVLFATRPLKPEELYEAVNIDLALPSQFNEPWPKLRRLSSTHAEQLSRVADFARIMSPFLVVEGSTVQLIHQSAKDFLIGRLSQIRVTPMAYAVSTNDRIFHCCEALLLDINESGQLVRYERPLSSYAAAHWYDHFLSRTDTSISERSKTLRSLCSPRSQLLQTWFPVWWEEKWSQGWERARFPRYPTKGIVLAFLGDEPELNNLLRRRIVLAGECTVKGEEWTPLMAAAWSGHEAVVDLLLSWHPSYELHPRLSARALIHAIDHGHKTIAQTLTMAFAVATPGPTPRRFRSLGAFFNGYDNPLVAATRRGSLEMMKLLIDAGAYVNLGSVSTGPASGWSPIHWAIREGHDDIVRLLLDNGAELDSRALSLACDSDDDDVVSVVSDELRRKGNGLWGPWDASAMLRFETKLRNKKFVAELLELGVDPALPDISGVSALETASRSGWADGVQLFHNLNHDGSGDTSMFLLSCQNTAVEIVKLLLELGISPNTSEPFEDRSAIQHVIAPSSLTSRDSPQRRLELIRLLLRYGADINHSNIWGETGLHLASRHREERIAALLVEAGADACAENLDGETALDLAARNGDTSLIVLLLNGGCPVRGATWRSALSSGNVEAVRCVLAHLRNNSPKGSSRELEGQPTLEPVPSEIAQHFVMCGDAPPRFQQATEYLRSRHILDNPRVELDFRDRLSFAEVLKAWWEKTTSAKWYWWPLTPPTPFLTPDEAWIRWSCGTGVG